jgi:hypothetical protein
METLILYPLNSMKDLPCEEKKNKKKREWFKGRRKRVCKSTERTGLRGSRIEGNK